MEWCISGRPKWVVLHLDWCIPGRDLSDKKQLCFLETSRLEAVKKLSDCPNNGIAELAGVGRLRM
jgi:hypothetical protein